MTAPVPWDAVVVGAGPAGSTTAALLARSGYRTLVLERARFPREKACADYIAPGARAALERLELLDAVARLAKPIDGMEITASSGVTMRGRFRGPGGFGLPRRMFDQMLAERAGEWGAAVWAGATVERVLKREGRIAGVVVRDEAHRRYGVEGRLIVGADGLRSIVARAMGGGRRTGERRLALVAHVAEVYGLRAVGEMFVDANAYAGLAPLPGGASVAVVIPTRLAARGVGPCELFWRELARFPTVHARVAGRPIVRNVIATGPFGWRSRRVVMDGALLVGDAARFFDPFTGDGLAAALAGGVLAADAAGAALRRPGPVTARALSPYRAARRGAFRGRWAAQRAVGFAIGHRALFDAGIATLARRPRAADRVVRVAAGLDRPSSLWRLAASRAEAR